MSAMGFATVVTVVIFAGVGFLWYALERYKDK